MTTKNIIFKEKKEKVNIKINKGINFCHVIKIKHIGHDKAAITGGNQKWQGAIPSFVIILIKNKNNIIILDIAKEDINKDIILVINIIELNNWIRKYLIEASREIELEELIIRGIIENKFNSNPLHRKSQWEEEKAINEPEKSVK